MKSNKFGYILRTTLPTIGGIGVLCTVFVVTPELVNGLVIGKQCWFHLATAFFALCVAITVVGQKGKINFSFSLPDVLAALCLITLICTYNWELRAEFNRFIFTVQLFFCWFLFRIVGVAYPKLIPFFICILIGTGCIEGIWGIKQLYGYAGSNHSLFRLTGSFYNPGPYSGYLALIAPLALGKMIELKNKEKKGAGKFVNKIIYYFSGGTLLLILTVLPAGMSRTAWIATAVSCGWISWIAFSGKDRLKAYWLQHRKRAVGILTGVVFLSLAITAGIYLLKKDSADGRFFMWKITSLAILERPTSGTGLGGFPAAYAQAQEAYFASEQGSDTEKRVAGSPAYAFNEWLQLGVEQGAVGCMLLLAFAGYCFYRALKQRQIGISGALLSLCIFSFASYPLQLPSFGIALTLLLVATVKQKQKPIPPVFVMLFTLLLVTGSCTLFYSQRNTYEAYHLWSNLKMLHQIKAYTKAEKGYNELSMQLNYAPDFLFEYAQCLSKTTHYAESNRILKKAALLRADPMIYNVMAKNYQAMGNYKIAEQWLFRSIQLLPERIYPYYLLTKLYAEPEFYHPEKMKSMAKLVLTKEPKVESMAIKEMRQEIKKILEN